MLNSEKTTFSIFFLYFIFAMFMLYSFKVKIKPIEPGFITGQFQSLKKSSNLGPKSTNLEESLKLHLGKFTNLRKICPFRSNLPVWIRLDQFESERINQIYADLNSHDLSSSESRSFVGSDITNNCGVLYRLYINIILKLGVKYLIWSLGFKQDCKLGKRLLKMDPFLVSVFLQVNSFEDIYVLNNFFSGGTIMVGLAPCTDNSVLDQGYLIFITNLLEKISRLLGGLISFFFLAN